MKKLLIAVIGLFLLAGTGWTLYRGGYFEKDISVSNDPKIAQIKKDGVLRIGLDATFPPMEQIDNKGIITGFDAELAGIIAQELGVKAELKNITWDNIFDELNDGNIDLILSSVTITLERSKTLSFSKPYLNAGQVILVGKDNNAIKGLSGLIDKKIGLQSDTTSEIEAIKIVGKDNVIGFANYDLAIEDLESKKIDAVFMDYPAAVGKTKTNSNLKIVGSPFTQEFYGVVASKDNLELINEVNKILEKLIKSGEMKKLENRWLR